MLNSTVKACLAACVALGVTSLARGQQATPTLPRPVPNNSSLGPTPLSLPCAEGNCPTTPPRATASCSQKGLGPGQRGVVVQAVCVRLPLGFCESVGLEAVGGEPVWALTPREVRMFAALLRTAPDKEIVSRPQLCILDRQTANCQVGQEVELVTGLEATTRDGITVYTPETAKLVLGTILRITPAVAGDGSVRVRVKGSYAALAGTPIPLPVRGSGVRTTGAGSEETVLQCVGGQCVVNNQELESAVTLAPGGAAVLGFSKKDSGQKPHELVWILSAHVVTAEKPCGVESCPTPTPTPRP